MVITPVVDAPEVLAKAEDVAELAAEVNGKLDEVVTGEYGPSVVAATLPPGVDSVTADGAGAPRTNGIIHNGDSSLDNMAAVHVGF